jgi:hypothetical protein
MSSNDDIIKKAKANHKKTMEKFEKAGGVFLFYDANKIKDEKFKPFLIGETEDDLEEKMDVKLKENPKKYEKYKIVRVNITGLEEDIGESDYIIGVGGSLGISVMVHKINEFNEIIYDTDDPAATFWYTDKVLAKKGFSADHIKKAVKLTIKGNLSNNPFKIYYIDKLEEYAKLKKKSKRTKPKSKSKKDKQ